MPNVTNNMPNATNNMPNATNKETGSSIHPGIIMLQWGYTQNMVNYWSFHINFKVLSLKMMFYF